MGFGFLKFGGLELRAQLLDFLLKVRNQGLGGIKLGFGGSQLAAEVAGLADVAAKLVFAGGVLGSQVVALQLKGFDGFLGGLYLREQARAFVVGGTLHQRADDVPQGCFELADRVREVGGAGLSLRLGLPFQVRPDAATDRFQATSAENFAQPAKRRHGGRIILTKILCDLILCDPLFGHGETPCCDNKDYKPNKQTNKTNGRDCCFRVVAKWLRMPSGASL